MAHRNRAPGGREMHHAHRHNVIKLQRAIVVETALHAFSTHQAYSLAPQPFAISLPPIRIIAFAPRLDPCIPKPARLPQRPTSPALCDRNAIRLFPASRIDHDGSAKVRSMIVGAQAVSGAEQNCAA
jgi:hypothetical protein